MRKISILKYSQLFKEIKRITSNPRDFTPIIQVTITYTIKQHHTNSLLLLYKMKDIGSKM